MTNSSGIAREMSSTRAELETLAKLALMISATKMKTKKETEESGSDLDLIESPQHKILISKAQEPDKVLDPDRKKIVCMC